MRDSENYLNVLGPLHTLTICHTTCTIFAARRISYICNLNDYNLYFYTPLSDNELCDGTLLH